MNSWALGLLHTGDLCLTVAYSDTAMVPQFILEKIKKVLR